MKMQKLFLGLIFLAIIFNFLGCVSGKKTNTLSIISENNCIDELSDTIDSLWLANYRGGIIQYNRNYWELFFNENEECFIGMQEQKVVNYLGKPFKSRSFPSYGIEYKVLPVNKEVSGVLIIFFFDENQLCKSVSLAEIFED